MARLEAKMRLLCWLMKRVGYDWHNENGGDRLLELHGTHVLKIETLGIFSNKAVTRK